MSLIEIFLFGVGLAMDAFAVSVCKGLSMKKMSLKSVKNGEKNQSVLEIEIPKADFEAEVNKVYKKQAPKITVPGFRKGKAPRAIVEKMYGKGIFYEDALNAMLPAVLDEAVKEAGIEVVSQPELDLGDIDENGVVTAVGGGNAVITVYTTA